MIPYLILIMVNHQPGRGSRVRDPQILSCMKQFSTRLLEELYARM